MVVSNVRLGDVRTTLEKSRGPMSLRNKHHHIPSGSQDQVPISSIFISPVRSFA